MDKSQLQNILKSRTFVRVRFHISGTISKYIASLPEEEGENGEYQIYYIDYEHGYLIHIFITPPFEDILGEELFETLSDIKIRELTISLGKSYTEIPANIGKITSLNWIDLSNNGLSELPDDIQNLKRLELLDISNNNFSEFPLQITRLPSLEVLKVSDNKISCLPPNIGKLFRLESLSISNNAIRSLPKEIKNLPRLKSLYLSSNNLPIPLEIQRVYFEGQRILDYYFSLVEQKNKPINEIKLIFVGQPEVGKTSLVQRIRHGTFDPNHHKTEGISQAKWKIPVENNEINVNIWDFGGQEIMHATHQFFLTKRSLYLLVLDARLGQEEDRVEYWLRMIQSFGGDSPVIVVGNKIDQQPLNIDRRGLQVKYSNIKAFMETSCLDGRGIEELKETIARKISKLPHVHDLLPESWFQVKEKLKSLDKDFIPYSEYEALCTEGGITDPTSQSTLIGFLHDLGSVLNFRDDPRLQETNILNPEWVTNGVYRILNSNELFHKKGVLETKQLSKMLDPKAYPRARHMFIVDMMRKFELCYPFEGDESKYLVPDLLPREEPFTGDWSDALAFEFHYSVLPGSIISRFIVRMHPFIHQHTVWRAGVVLKSGENLAQVKADYEDKRIFIRVTGDRETRRDVLSMVRGTLDAIHKTITGLDAVAKVPHPDYPELVLDYDELIEFEKQGIDFFPRKVGNQIVTVAVKQLLDGVEGKSASQVFISYAHADKRITNKLLKSLEAAGIRVWKDDKNIQGGAEWHQAIASGITQSKLVLNVLTPDSLQSEFVEKELIFATYNAKKKIIPLRVKDCQPPLLLANLQYVDFYRKNYERTFEELLELIRDNL